MKELIDQYLEFFLDDKSYALRIEEVLKVVGMVEITVFPGSPETVLGVINFQGEMIPVLDLRKCFGLPDRRIEPEDQLIIVAGRPSIFAITIDHVSEITSFLKHNIKTGFNMSPTIDFPSGLSATQEGTILIQEMSKLLPGMNARRAG